MQEISFYCRKCKCSLHMSMVPSGKPDKIVMDGVFMKCKRDKRVITLKKVREGDIISKADKEHKFYI